MSHGLQRPGAVRSDQFGPMLAQFNAALKGAQEDAAVVVQVGGWLVESLPDAGRRQRFEARTQPVALP